MMKFDCQGEGVLADNYVLKIFLFFLQILANFWTNFALIFKIFFRFGYTNLGRPIL